MVDPALVRLITRLDQLGLKWEYTENPFGGWNRRARCSNGFRLDVRSNWNIYQLQRPVTEASLTLEDETEKVVMSRTYSTERHHADPEISKTERESLDCLLRWFQSRVSAADREEKACRTKVKEESRKRFFDD